MRLLGVLGVLCFAAAPVMGDAIDYTFDVVAGSLSIDFDPDGAASPDPAVVTVDGSFNATIDQSDCHIGESDYITLDGANIYNDQEVVLSLLQGIATVTIPVNSAIFTGFVQPDPAHIGPGGIANVEADVCVDAALFVVGLITTTFTVQECAGEILPFTVTVSTSAERSDAVTVTIAGTFSYEIGISDVSLTVTIDLIIDVVGTAHVVPDPALGGLTALGLGGAGAWLRRRRS